MPALVLCGRRTGVSSDDFVIFPSIGVALRALLIMCIMPIAFFYSYDCEEAWLFSIYLVGAVAIYGLALILELSLALVSSRGAMRHTKWRRPVSGLLIASMAASLLECGWAIFGTYWAFSSNHCVFSAPEFVLFLRIVVLVNWIHFVIVALAYAALFISSTSSKLDHNDAEVVSLVWRDRLASLCCCIKMDDSDAQVFVEIGKVAADLFVGVDVTPSDVAASLVVLNHEDEQAQRSAEHPKGPMVKLKELKEVHYWLRYATAVYGWMHYVYARGLTSACDVFPCVAGCTPRSYVRGDNFGHMEGAAMLRVLDNAADVLHADFDNSLYSPPFFIARDRESQKIVIAVRGTLSFRDAVIDMEAGSTEFEFKLADGQGVRCLAHRGILTAANRLMRRIRDTNLLGDISVGPDGGHELVIVGHSLGAGTAVLLSLMLHSEYPKHRCFAYGPPGGLMSKKAAEISAAWITGVAVGLDWIPRLSLPAVEEVKLRILDVMVKSRVPKYRLLCWPLCHCCVSDDEFNEALVESSPLLRDSHGHIAHNAPLQTSVQQSVLSDSQGDSTVVDLDHEVENALEEEKKVAIDVAQRKERLYPPARLMHVISERAVWRDYRGFDQLIISGQMLRDHMPEIMLERVAAAISAYIENVDSDSEKAFL